MSWRASIALKLGDFALDVSLEGGEGALALVGPNGSGKTTLLRAIAGAVPTERAEIRVGERVLASAERSLPIEARGVGYVPQGYGLFPHLGVLDNVAFGLSTGARRLAPAERRAKARAILERLGAGALAERLVSELSGGEKQRVALARALVIEPALLLLDEPMAALDVRRRRSVRAFLAERLAQWGQPALIATHDARDAVALGARLVVLDGGSVVQQGTAAELRADPVNDFVAELLATEG